MTVAAEQARQAARTPDAPALVSGNRRWTAGELAADVRSATAQLGGLPVGPVAILLAEPAEQLIWALAADAAGAIAAVLDTRWPVPHRDAALALVGAAAIVRTHDHEAVVRRVAACPPHDHGGRGWIAFTSGSSGVPGAVLRRPTSWSDSYAAFTRLTDIAPGDRVLVPGPLSSSLCAYAALHAVAEGAAVVLLPRWDPGRFPAVDVAHLVPAMLADLIGAPAAVPPRVVVSAGATLEPGLELRARQRWPDLRIVEYYGSTEQSFVTARVGGDAATVGAPFPGVELQIRSDNGRPLPPGTPGVIWTRSPYAGERELGAREPAGRVGGWLSVGDRGVLDAAGILTLLGRERIVTGGATVEPAVVETVLRELAGVRDAVVVGLPHERLGEVVAAAMDCEPGLRLGTAREHARTRLSAAQRPRHWYAAVLPRTANGKPARAEVTAAVRAGLLRRLS